MSVIIRCSTGFLLCVTYICYIPVEVKVQVGIIKCVFLCIYMLTSEVGGKLDYSPVSWREYFDQMEDVNVGPADSRDIFRIYKAGSDGPLLVLLHGGGHSALSWAVFTVSICTLQLLHGYILNVNTACFSIFQTAIASRVTCRVLAMDLRGHGEFFGLS